MGDECSPDFGDWLLNESGDGLWVEAILREKEDTLVSLVHLFGHWLALSLRLVLW